MSGDAMAEAVRRREVSPVELVDAVLDRLERTEPKLNAFVTVVVEQAREQARSAEKVVMTTAPEDLPPIFGVPVTVKDLSDTAGIRTTYGAVAYKDHVPTRDSISWGRLKAAGGILIGKTTTPEFGGLGVTQSGLTGVTNNPWKLTHTAGGSSGGAASSVAAGVGALAWGSDGGGSVRIPAACCGVVGLKPSRGRIPTEILWESVASDGPLTRTVIDSALLLQVTSGPHHRDPFALEQSGQDYVGAVRSARDLSSLRLAFAPNPAGAAVDNEVASIVSAAVAAISSAAGCEVDQVELDVPDPVDYFVDYWSPAFPALIDLLTDGNPDRAAEMGVPAATIEMARRGAEITTSAYLHAAGPVRGEIYSAFDRVLSDHDLLITPTMPVAAFPHPGDLGGNSHVNGVPAKIPSIDFHRFTESPSHAGLPAITVPCGFTRDGLPVGLQIVGPLYADAAVLAAAAVIEQVLPWSNVRPSL
ncbi:amidase [Microbacterium sp. Root180]|uniref:amidase n=1 Tax=Microbacterium sp. Root180 TaxID=1736483 RepID=UPI001910F252|nr:amidase family protein [Microbacterium sp. Root180]